MMHLVGKKTVSQKAFTVANTLFMLLFMAIILYPVLNILAISLSEDTPVLTGRVTIYPMGWDLTAYQNAFNNKLLISSYINTIFVAVVGSCFPSCLPPSRRIRWPT